MCRLGILILLLTALALCQCSDKPNEPESNTPLNHAPVFAAAGMYNVMAEDTLHFDVTATDPDGDSLTLTPLNNPQNSHFTDNGDGTGDLVFMPQQFQVDVFQIRFIASDGRLSDTLKVQIAVLAQPNRAPVLTVIDTASVMEADTLRLTITATDPDGTQPEIELIGPLANSSLVGPLDDKEFTIVPDSTQIGLLTVAFTACDGDLCDTTTVAVTVIELPNEPPTIAIEGDTLVLQGDTLTLRVTASDPDGAVHSLTAVTLPENAVYDTENTASGVLTFAPDYIQLGPYQAVFVARDHRLADTLVVNLLVLDAPNQAPRIAPIAALYAFVADTLVVQLHARDVDGTVPTLVALDAPENSTFEDHQDGSGTFDFVPAPQQTGNLEVLFIADDGELQDSLSLSITVFPDTQSFRQEGPIPAAVGNYWVYQIEGFGTLTVSIVGKQARADGRIWWVLDGELPIVGSSFSIAGDTIFAAQGLFVLQDGFGYSNCVDNRCFGRRTHYLGTCDCEAQPCLVDRDCFQLVYWNGSNDGSINEYSEVAQLSRGTGIVHCSQYQERMSGSDTRIYRLIDYHLE